MVSITDVVRQFKQKWTEELSPTAIAQACRDVGMSWYESTLNPVVVIQIFLVQVLGVLGQAQSVGAIGGAEEIDSGDLR